MSDFRIIFGFCALLVWVYVFVKKSMAPSVAPLAVVCGTALWFTLFGCLGILMAGGWLFYAVTCAAVVYAVLDYRKTPKFTLPNSWGLWFFIIASFITMLLLLRSRPMFTTWDEFSFWGTAGKLTKLNNELYPTTSIGWIWPATQTPATIAFNYFIQFWGGAFSEWQTYFAVNLIQFAAMAACLAPLANKQWEIALPVMATLLLTPYMFIHYAEPMKISPVYMDSLADVTMGLLFGGALAAYFSGKSKKIVHLLPAFLAVAMLTITKDTGFLFAAVAVMLMFLDTVFCLNGGKLRGRAGASLRVLGAGLAAVLVPFLGWSAYLKVAVSVNRFNLGGIKNVSMLELPFLALREGFSSQPSEKFMEVMQQMPRMFVKERITLLGSGLMVATLCLLLVLGAAVITTQQAQRRRCVVFGVFSSLGFIAYYLFIALTYIYIFRPEQTFESYERYVYPYYIGWFIASVCLFGASAAHSRWKVEGKSALLALSLLFVFRFWQFIPLPYSVLGVNTAEYNWRREFALQVDKLTSRLEKNGRTFIVSSGDSGALWFQYSYQMLPWIADYSFGGGSLIERRNQPDGTVQKHELNVEEWEEYLLETGCTTVFIDYADESFYEMYQTLFEDGMQEYFVDGTQLYDVIHDNGHLFLRPAGS